MMTRAMGPYPTADSLEARPMTARVCPFEWPKQGSSEEDTWGIDEVRAKTKLIQVQKHGDFIAVSVRRSSDAILPHFQRQICVCHGFEAQPGGEA